MNGLLNAPGSALARWLCVNVLFLQGQYSGLDVAEGMKPCTILAPGLQALTTCTEHSFQRAVLVVSPELLGVVVQGTNLWHY